MTDNQPTSLAGRRIFLIEDTEDARRLMRFVLQMADAEVIEEASATDVVAIAKSEQPDLILMDVHMPGINGLTATRLLRAEAETREIPIVIVTASAMKHERDEAKAAGCDGFMTKPIDVTTFARDVAQFLRPASAH